MGEKKNDAHFTGERDVEDCSESIVCVYELSFPVFIGVLCG